MKHYDFAKATSEIEKNKDKIISANLGMAEDWFLASEEVWTKEDGYLFDLTAKEGSFGIMGISASKWATPVLKLHFNEGLVKEIPCFKFEGELFNYRTSPELKEAEKLMKEKFEEIK